MIQKRLRQNINTSAIIDNTGNTQDITQLKIDVANNTQSITTNTNDIANLQTQVSQNTQDITGFNQITTDLQTKYNGLESKVTQNQTNINDLQNKANQLEPRVAQNETDIAAIKLDTAKIDPLVTRVDTLEPIVTGNQTKITQNENDINTLQTTVQNLEPRVTANEASITTINSTLTNVAKKNEQNTFTMQQNFNADIVLTNSSIKSTTGDLNINEGGSHVQVKTDLLMNDHWIANLHDPNSPQDAATKNYVDNANTAISNRVTNLETSLANGNIVNYVGTYDAATTYAIGQCVTFNDKWYVSKINGNVGNQPDTSSTQWELLSAPAVDLTPYLTKQEASTTYETITNVNALTTRVSTNEQSIATINTTLNGVAKLATDNTFTANNTFNNAITTNTGLYTTNTDMLVAKQDAQAGKTMHFDFKQPTGVFKNYCYVNYRFTTNDTNFTTLLSMEFRPDTGGTDNNQVILSTDLAKISFNKPIVGIPTPTENAQVANKEYVDTATNGCAKLASANTFSQVNTFNESINVLLDKAIQMGYDSNTFKLRLGGASGGNDGFIVAPHGDLRVNEGGTGRVNIKTDVLMNDKFIAGLHDPNSDQDAANKRYVDSRTTTYKWEGVVNNGNTQNLLNIGWDKHIIGIVLFRKRSDNQWFYMNSNMSQQIYRLDSGQFCLYGANASGSPTFNNDYKIFITYIN